MKESNKIYKVKISLLDIEPKIWRRILVKSNVLLPDLHKIIQTVMGWFNVHLHEFQAGKRYYGIIDDDYPEENLIDYSNISLNKVLKKIRSSIYYIYDFGDNWKHKITLEKILEPESNKYYPVCVAGERACPPEDCGSTIGYENLLKILKNPKHPEYKDFKEWVGDSFDPEKFDIEWVNKLLKEENFGCIDMDLFDF